MVLHEQHGIPLHVRSTDELMKYMPNERSSEQYYIQKRCELMTEVLNDYCPPNGRGIRFSAIARQIHANNEGAMPYKFYSAQGGIAAWESMKPEKQAEKIMEKLRDVVNDNTNTYVPLDRIKRKEPSKNEEKKQADKGGRFPPGRPAWIDFLLYMRAYDPRHNLNTSDGARQRVERFNAMLSVLGYSDLYLFDPDDYMVIVTLLLDLPYPKYLELVQGSMGALLMEMKEQTDAESKARRPEKPTDLSIPLPDGTQEHPYTGAAEERFLFCITAVGEPTDPPLGTNEPSEGITAFQFIRKFTSEFGRARRSVYRVMTGLFGDCFEDVTDMLSRGDTERDLMEDLLSPFAFGEYYEKDDITFKRILLAGLIDVDNCKKDERARLVQCYTFLRHYIARLEYDKAIRDRNLSPDANVVDVALTLNHSRYLVPSVIECYRRIDAQYTVTHVRHNRPLNEMTPEERDTAHRIFMSESETLPSILMEETDEYEDENGKPRQKKHVDNSDEITLRDDAEELSFTVPPSFRMTPDMVTHTASLSRTALLASLLFALSDVQVRGILKSTGRSYTPRRVIEIGNALTESLNQILRACDQPILRAQASEIDYLLLTAIYNTDYGPILNRDPNDRRSTYPYRQFYVELYPAAEDGAEDGSF